MNISDFIGHVLLGGFMVGYGIQCAWKQEVPLRLRGMTHSAILATGMWAISSGVAFIIGGSLVIYVGRYNPSSTNTLLAIAGLIIPVGITAFCVLMETLIDFGRALGESQEKPKRKEKPKNDEKPKRED